MHEDLRQGNHYGELRHPVVHSHRVQYFRILDQPRPTIDPQRIVEPGNDEQQADVRIAQYVGQAVESVVPRPVWNGDRLVIQDLHKAGRIAARAHVGFAFEVLRADTDKWRTGNKLPGVLIQRRLALSKGQRMCRTEQCSERCLIINHMPGVDMVLAHSLPFFDAVDAGRPRPYPSCARSGSKWANPLVDVPSMESSDLGFPANHVDVVPIRARMSST